MELYHDPMSVPMGATMSTGRAGVPSTNLVNNTSAPVPSKRPAATIKPRPSPLMPGAESAQASSGAAQLSPVFGAGSGSHSPLDIEMAAQQQQQQHMYSQYAQTSPTMMMDMYGGGGGASAASQGMNAYAAAAQQAAYTAAMLDGGQQRPEQLHSRLSMIMGELHEIMGMMQRSGMAAPGASAHQQQQQALAMMQNMQRFGAAGGVSPISASGPFSVTADAANARGSPHMGAQQQPSAMTRVSVGPRITPEPEPAMAHHIRNSVSHPPSRLAQARAYNTGTSYQAPASAASPVVIIVVVEFKANRLKKYQSGFFVSPGTYVMVEGDRGIDCGLAVHCTARRGDGSVDRLEAVDDTLDVSRLKPASSHVIRTASPEEIALLHGELATVERGTLARCRELVEEMNLPMSVLECEYQFDRKKVSFYFESDEPVDFRELARELHKVYNSRIWLENVNTKVKNVVPDGALSQADKMMFIEMGLKPPRQGVASAAAPVAHPLPTAPAVSYGAGQPVYGQRRRLADIRAAAVVEEVHHAPEPVAVVMEEKPMPQASRRPIAKPQTQPVVIDEEEEVPAVTQARQAMSRGSPQSVGVPYARPVPRSAQAAATTATAPARPSQESTEAPRQSGGGGARRGGYHRR